MKSPLESFNLIELYNGLYPLDITNSTVYIVVCGLLFIIIFITYNTRNIKYNWFKNLLNTFTSHLYNNTKDYNYIPYLITTFMFILIANLIGLVPYSFTITGQFIITLFLSFSNMVGITLIGLYKHGLGWFGLFVPKGVNKAILPFVIIIEVISYLSRVLSLPIRLTANMIAGHCILAIFSGLGLLFFNNYVVMVPFIMGILLLELLVALIQSYVYTILVSTYIKDTVHLH